MEKGEWQKELYLILSLILGGILIWIGSYWIGGLIIIHYVLWLLSLNYVYQKTKNKLVFDICLVGGLGGIWGVFLGYIIYKKIIKIRKLK